MEITLKEFRAMLDGFRKLLGEIRAKIGGEWTESSDLAERSKKYASLLPGAEDSYKRIVDARVSDGAKPDYGWATEEMMDLREEFEEIAQGCPG